MKRINKIYIYDGSFEGLLTVVYYSLKESKIPTNIVKKGKVKTSLFETYESIDTEYDKSSIIFKSIPFKISDLSLYNVYNAFLSNKNDKELSILYYLINGFKYGYKIDSLRNLNCVCIVQKYAKMVKREMHRLKGFVRFKTVNGVLYSELEPDNDILELLVPHFKKRLSNEKWIIKDNKRNKAAFYNMNEVRIVNTNNIDLSKIRPDNEEKKYQFLWKSFIKSVNIKERKNLKCQRNFMPKKYWKYMSETEN